MHTAYEVAALLVGGLGYGAGIDHDDVGGLADGCPTDAAPSQRPTYRRCLRKIQLASQRVVLRFQIPLFNSHNSIT